MKNKKLLSILLAGVMVLSMAACGGEGSEESNGTDVQQTGSDVAVTEASIDFEDGQNGFVMMYTKPRKSDDSNLSVKDYNGSKALYVENVTGGELYIGIDVDALLGDKVTEVCSIQMDIGTEYSDGSFSASAGNLYAYTGADLTENKLNGWSVYMANKNPKTAVFDMKDGDGNPISFTAGANNYIMLVKDDDTGAVSSSMYLDNIVFFDGNGAVIEADTSAVMEEPFEGYRKVVKEEEEAPAAGSVTVALDQAYAGDWGAITAIPAAEFAAFSGDVTVTLKFELQSGYDYYLLNPIDFADWGSMKDNYTDLVAKDKAEEGDKYHLQSDGFIVIDDWSNGEMTFTINAAGVEKIKNGGAGLSGQTYGVTVYEAVLSGTAGAAAPSETVVLDDAYKGDWGQTTTIGADVLSKYAGADLTVTYKFELESGYDYWLWAPMDAAWTRLNAAMTGLPAKSAAEEGDLYHMQDDGFIVIDNTDNNELTFTIKAADLDAIIAAGGLSGQTYGVTTYEVVLTGAATAAAPSETVVLDDAYKGDWGQTTVIGADVLSKYAGADLTVEFKIELESGYDYWLWAPMDAAWTKLGSAMTGLPEKSAAEEGDLYHMQSDGFMVMDDTSNDTITFTIKAADLDAIIAAGGLSGQTYGVTTYEVKLTGAAPAAAAAATTVALDDVYVGDWGQTTVIGADVLSAYAGKDITVTFSFELESGYDYYLWAPMDAAWTKLGSAMTGLPEKSAAEEGDLYHMQSDGFMVIDDQSNTEITFTIKAADLDAIIAAGGLSGQTYGVTVYEAKIQ